MIILKTFVVENEFKCLTCQSMSLQYSQYLTGNLKLFHERQLYALHVMSFLDFNTIVVSLISRPTQTQRQNTILREQMNTIELRVPLTSNATTISPLN